MNNLKEKLEKIVEKHLQLAKGNGYAVSVELDGKSLLKHYSGEVEFDEKYYPVYENTPFETGSLAKQFTACCIAILACKKRINLDDSVRVYLPELKEYAEKITVRHCLSMTSGARSIYCLKHMQSNSPLDGLELFLRQEQPSSDAGNFTSYSNVCYSLLGWIAEKITGDIKEFAKQRILDPLGMKNTQLYGDMGADGLMTTPEDLVLWHNCLTNKILPGAPEGLFDLIFSPSYFNNGELCPYGFGFFYDDNDRDIIWQHGDMADWQCLMRLYLKKKLSIIVFTHHINNRNYEPIKMALDLENAVIGELFDLPEQGNYIENYYRKPGHPSKMRKVEHAKFPDAKKQNPAFENNWGKYTGRYYSDEMDTYFDIYPDGSRLQIKYADRNDDGYINLLGFEDDNRLVLHLRGDWGGDWLEIEFYGNEQKIDFFTLREGIGHFYFVKCLPCHPDEQEMIFTEEKQWK